MGKQTINALNNRVWYVEGGVHPSRAPVYLALGKFGDPAWSSGDTGRVGAPDPQNFDRDIQVGSIPGSIERPTLSVMSRYTVQKNELLRLFRKQCRVDWFALVGKCGDPQNFSQGGEKWVYFPDGRFSNHSFENFGAFARDENNPTNSNTDLTAEEYFELFYEEIAQKAEAEAVRETPTIDVCDGVECGDCGDESDGCQRVLATMVGTGATPGTVPVLLYSEDGGQTWSSQNISSMFSNETITGAHCIAGDIVIITSTGNELHYTNVDDLFIGQNAWNQTDSGFVVGGEPLAIWSVDARHTWIVGNGGYIYFVENHKIKVTVQDPGSTTTQNLNDVHAYDKENVLAVGNSNTVLVTRNGGKSWEAVTGPAVGENLGACWMWGENVWFVGTGAGGSGKLYWTDDGGFTWTEKDLPITVSRFDRIKFVSEAEGYISARSGGQSYILRTITGGYEWVVLPDDPSGLSIPDNSYISDLAVCQKDSNTVFGSGLGDNGTAGFIVKASGP